MLETDATVKWCPFSLESNTTRFCVGSGCMAWRGMSSDDDESKLEGIRRRREETGEGLSEAKNYVERHPEYLRKAETDLGFCSRLAA